MPIRTPLNTKLSSSYTLAGSTIEDIDYALYNFINDDLNIFVDTNEGFEKVPVLYSNHNQQNISKPRPGK